MKTRYRSPFKLYGKLEFSFVTKRYMAGTHILKLVSFNKILTLILGHIPIGIYKSIYFDYEFYVLIVSIA